jgi:LmbE family N-acetylglucosaminyl deacetylase
MISQRPTLELGRDDRELLAAIDGRATVSELSIRYPGSAPTLARWAAMEVVELTTPAPAPSRPHLLVIEPHMDDAALSVGGRMLNRRGRERMTILTVVKRSNYTSYMLLKRDYFDVDRIVDLRLQESRLAAELLGAEHRCLDAVDAPLRFLPADQWRLETLERVHAAAGAYTDSTPSTAFVAGLSEALLHECMRLEPDELWFPIGLGSHMDHRATRSACIQMLPELLRQRPGLKFSAYEDLPYSAVESTSYSSTRHVAAIAQAFAARGTTLRQESEPIDEVFDRKIRAISIFASQFKRSAMAPKLHECARDAGPCRLSERYYRLEGTLRLPNESALAPDAESLSSLRRTVIDLVSRRGSIRRLAIVLLPNSHLGNWREDRANLLAAFPQASLHVYVPKASAWEADGTGDPRVKVSVVADGQAGLLDVARREVLSLGTPTLLVSWGAYGAGSRSKQAVFEWTFPLREAIWVRTLTDLCAVIADEIASSPA